jgi:ATP-dependent Clp protease ATP-binding subunit ClpC
LSATPEAVDKLANMGYDPDMGARPLKRIIQQKVEDVLSDSMLSGKFEDGDTVIVDVEEDEIVLTRATKEETPPPEVMAAA